MSRVVSSKTTKKTYLENGGEEQEIEGKKKKEGEKDDVCFRAAL